jgi:hypothetical protein
MGRKSSPASGAEKIFGRKDIFRQFVMSVTQLSFDIREAVAQNIEQAG